MAKLVKSASKAENWKQTAIVAWAIIGVFALLWISSIILKQLEVVVPLIIYTTVLVYILRPAVEKLHSRNVPRGLAVVATYLVVAAFVGLLAWYLLPIISKQFIAFAKFPAKFFPVVQEYGENLLETYKSRLGGTLFDLDKFVASFANQAKEFGLGVIAGLPKATIDLFGSMINLILAPILAFYILKDLPAIKESVSELIPRKNRDEVLTIIHKINLVVAGFLKGQLTVALILGILVSIWLWVIGVDFPFVLGMIAGVLNIIPYLGPIIGGTLAVLVAAFNPVAPVFKIVLVMGGMFAIQQLDSAVISPQVMKRHVDLHPTLIVLGLLIGGSLMGIMGMLIAIPVLAVAKVLLYHFVGKQDIF